MPDYYGDPQTLIKVSGMRARDFALDTEAELFSIVEQWYREAKGIIDAHRKRNFLDEHEGDAAFVPMIVHHCADRLVANMIALAQARRGTPVMRVGDYEIRLTGDDVLTPDIAEILGTIPFGSSGASGSSTIRVMAITGADEDEDDV